MPDWSPPSNEQIAQEAYLLWEADGRPLGLDYEYWMRASGVLNERARRAAQDAAAREHLEHVPWTRRIEDKPTRRASVRAPKRLPRRRGPGTWAERLAK